MENLKTSGTLGLAILAVLASSNALAAEPGFYGGINVGQSMATIDDERITSNLLSQGFTGVSIADDDRDVGFKIFGGYQINRYFAIEGGYVNLGEFGYTATTTPAGTMTGNIELQGVNLDVVGILPFTEKLSAFARAGVLYAEAKDTFTTTGLVINTNPNPSKRDTNYKFGVGLQYDITEKLGMRLEAERYRIDDAIGNKGDIWPSPPSDRLRRRSPIAPRWMTTVTASTTATTSAPVRRLARPSVRTVARCRSRST